MRDFIENKALDNSMILHMIHIHGENKQTCCEGRQTNFLQIKSSKATIHSSSLVIGSCVVLAPSGISMRMHAYSRFLDGIYFEFN